MCTRVCVRACACVCGCVLVYVHVRQQEYTRLPNGFVDPRRFTFVKRDTWRTRHDVGAGFFFGDYQNETFFGDVPRLSGKEGRFFYFFFIFSLSRIQNYSVFEKCLRKRNINP